MVRVLRWRLSLVLVLSSACAAQGTRASLPIESPAVGGSTQLASAAPAVSAAPRPEREGPARVVFASPRGEVVGVPEIAVAFDRPMRSLDDVDAPVPVTMTPGVPGRWRWLGTAAAEFESEGPLPRATSFELAVPAGTRASDGSVLPEAFLWSFETERPTVLSIEAHSPTHGDSELDGELPRDAFWRLTLSQPTSDEEVARALRLDVGEGEGGSPSAVPFDLRRSEPGDRNRVDVVPRGALPSSPLVTLTIDPARLRTTKEAEWHLSWQRPTPAPPAAGIRCPGRGCLPNGGVILSFSNPVTAEDVLRAVEVTPRASTLEAVDLSSQKIYLRGAFRPGVRTRVRLRGGALRDSFGQLVPAVQATLPFEQHQKEVLLGVTGEYLEAGLVKALPVFSLGVSRLEAEVKRLDEAGFLSWGSRRLMPMRPDARLSLHPRQRDGFTRSELPLSGQLQGKAPHGAVWVGLSVPGPSEPGLSLPGVRSEGWRDGRREGRREERAEGLLQVTDLALTVKTTPSGALVWVSRLSTGEPVANAEVAVTAERERMNATTDSQGLALIEWSEEPAKPLMLSARLGDEWVVLDATRGRGWRPVPAEDRRFPPDADFGAVWTERAEYRSGDTVKLRGVVRSSTTEGITTPARRPLAVRVVGPLPVDDDGRNRRGDVVTSERIAASAFGSFHWDFVLPATTGPGRYEVSALGVAGASTTFELTGSADAALSVCVDAEQTSYLRGAAARLLVHGEARGGRSLAGHLATAACTHRPTTFVVPGAEGFTTRDDARVQGGAGPQADSEALGEGAEARLELPKQEGTLDAVGRLTVEQSLGSVAAHGPERVTCAVEVQAPSAGRVAATTAFLVHPTETYAGLRLVGGRIQEARKAVVLEALALAPTGARRQGVPVRVELQRRLSRGGLRDELVDSCDVLSGEGPVRCALLPREPGRYLARATVVDTRGNSMTASLLLFAVEPAATASDVPALPVDWGVSESESGALRPVGDFEVVLDRPSYAAGETARALVLSPFERAEALVTVEGAMLHSYRRVVLSGRAPLIEFPVTEQLRPNAFVSIVLVRGRTLPPPTPRSGADPGAPAVRAGYAGFLVDPERRRLTVRVRPSSAAHRADGQVDVEVEVTDSQGVAVPAEVTLFALDKHARATSAVEAPDLLGAMTALRGDAIQTFDVRQSLARILPLPEVAPIGQCGLMGEVCCDSGRRSHSPSAAPTLAGFLGVTDMKKPLRTDAEGRVRTTLRLAKGGSPHEIVALGVARDDRYGAATSRIDAAPSLALRAFVPRRLHPGDLFDAVVALDSTLPSGTSVELHTSATGGVGLDHETQRVEVGPDGQAIARVRLSAQAAGDATLTLHARAGDLEATTKKKRVVREAVRASAVERGLYVEKRLTVVRPGETRATAAALPETPQRVASTRGFHVGDRVLVDLLVVATEECARVSIEDPLPAGVEPLEAYRARKAPQGKLARAVRLDPEKPTAVLPDEVLWSAETLSPGVHHWRYLVRLTSAGRFHLPPTRVVAESPAATEASSASSVIEVLP